MKDTNIYFLNHSGVVIDDGRRCYVFDYYKDPKGIVQSLYTEGRELWFFVSHSHGDHYNPEVFSFDSKKAVYVVHAAISLPQGLSGRTYSLSPYDVQLIDEVEVHMYGSTDEGGSFYVDTGRKQFFHAGDLNWWYWMEDIEANKRQATIDARRELDKLTHMAVDVAFFPVDARLETAREWGALSFLRRVKVRKAFVPIHSNGFLWQPSVYFKALYEDVPLWIPKMDGEMVTV